MIEDFSKRGIELCLAVYRITDKFPKDEILRNKLRTISIDINEFLIYNKINPAYLSRVFDLEKKLKLFFEYCTIAEKQRWVRVKNFQILRDEYKRLHDDLLEYWSNLAPVELDLITKSSRPAGEARPLGAAKTRIQKRSKTNHKNHDLSERQEQMVKFLGKSSEGLTMEDLAVALGISKKTIERDLKLLIRSRLAYKEGQTRSLRFFSKI